MEEPVYVVDDAGMITTSEASDETLEEIQVPVDQSQDGSQIDVSDPFVESSAAAEDLLSSEDIVIPFDGSSIVSPLSDDVDPLASDAFKLDNMVIFRAYITGYDEECTILVPSDEAVNFTIENGVLYNWSDHNIACPFFPGEVTDRISYNTLFITFLGRASTSFANNTYRNGSAQYVTTYSVSSSTLLQGVNTYVAVSGASQDGYSHDYWFSVVVIVCLVIMAANGLIRFLRRGIRG